MTTSTGQVEQSDLFFRQDDIREALGEAHARPALPIQPPCRVLQLAFRGSDPVIDAMFAVATGDATQTGPRHVVARIDGLKIKLERHTEFTSMMVVADDRNPDPQTVFAPPPQFDFSSVELLVQTDIVVFAALKDVVKHLPTDKRVYGGTMANAIDVRTALQPDDTGRITVLVHAGKTSPDEFGRRLQRLIEMETYRVFSLIGLPVARRASARIKRLEDRLTEITAEIKDSAGQAPEASERLFDELSGLSAEASAIVAQTRFRFSASRAYYDLVRQRIGALAEEKVGDVPTLSGFVSARLEPAIATIESTGRRQVVLSDDITRALQMLRTRVELNLNRANQKLLQSMDQRHQQHVKIAQAVESLSAVAITYYAVSLLAYVFKGLDKVTGIEWLSTVAVAVSAPIVLFIVWSALRRVREGLNL